MNLENHSIFSLATEVCVPSASSTLGSLFKKGIDVMNVNEAYFRDNEIVYEDEKYSSLIGNKIGQLTIEHVFHKKEGRQSRLIVACKCECGKITYQRMECLRKGKVKTCGCSNHGLANTRLYFVWKNIKNRCTRKNLRGYSRYGGRGIGICEEWEKSPKKFIDWCLANGYKNGLQIDRIDNNKGYSADNCRFVTPKENQRNKENNVLLKFNGETRTVSEWSEIVGLPTSCLRSRLDLGWTVEDALTKPKDENRVRPKKGTLIEYEGEIHTVLEWSRIKKLKWWTIQNRLKLGWDAKRIFGTKEKG